MHSSLVDLFVLRHGIAEERSPSGTDEDRRLTGKGKDELKILAWWMADQGLSFNVIATSPLTRARETAAIIAKKIGNESAPEIWKSLAPGGDPGSILLAAAKSGRDSRVLIIGHEPCLSTVIARVIAGNSGARITLGKGCLATIRNFSVNGDFTGELQWLVCPKLLVSRR